MTEYIARKMKVENLFKMGHNRASATIQLHPHATDIVTRNFFLRSLMFAFIASTCTRALADIRASATLQLSKEAQPYEAVDTSQQFNAVAKFGNIGGKCDNWKCNEPFAVTVSWAT
jgi:hypothetical protein